jgi:hypothetical protein
MCLAIEAWAAEVGAPKRSAELAGPPPGLDARLEELLGEGLRALYRTVTPKAERGAAAQALKVAAKATLAEEAAAHAAANDGAPPYSDAALAAALKRVESRAMRRLVLEEGLRADGRGAADVRPIESRCGLLPRAHGSALFTRGETQALAVATLGCRDSAQRVDSMREGAGGEDRRFYLQVRRGGALSFGISFFLPSALPTPPPLTLSSRTAASHHPPGSTSSPPRPSARPGAWAAPGGARSATERSRSARSRPSSPTRPPSPTPCALSRRSPRAMAPPRWRASAAAASRCSTQVGAWVGVGAGWAVAGWSFGGCREVWDSRLLSTSRFSALPPLSTPFREAG